MILVLLKNNLSRCGLLYFAVIGKKAGLSETDILLLPVDVTKLELHQQYFDAVLKHFGTV